MTLLERLQEIPDGTIVRFGAKNGAGWIICDDIKNFRDKEIMDSISDRFYKIKQKSLQKLYSFINTMPKNVTKKFEYIKLQKLRLADAIDSEERARFKKLIKIGYRGLNKIKKEYPAIKNRLIPKNEEYLKNFIPFSEREIIDEYEVDVFDKGIAIIVDGNEQGEFWTVNEMKGKREKIYGKDYTKRC